MKLNLDTIRKAGQVVLKAPRQFIFREGDNSWEMYVLLGGKVSIYLERGDKKIRGKRLH
jgi:hypothetical protein